MNNIKFRVRIQPRLYQESYSFGFLPGYGDFSARERADLGCWGQWFAASWTNGQWHSIGVQQYYTTSFSQSD